MCNGNATRSVLAGRLVAAACPALRVVTAGTIVLEGLPMSFRTRDALISVGLDHHGHSPTQLRADHVAAADVIVGLETDNVRYVRRRLPTGAAKAVTLKRLARDLPAGPEPLRDRVAALNPAAAHLEPWEDVDDPGGQAAEAYLSCAQEIKALVDTLVPRLIS
ncbi:hypothetical protein [Amycolatopsis anabasis]|uniref:arsenate reductase/protein-tyrosine-phosphatase family protein n=1 Tax=Amycolatopsis anabasis TaxID=1840409 RepID=UPI00131CB877|nr:hypothetical protein [Amycolatopsis anabasis]